MSKLCALITFQLCICIRLWVKDETLVMGWDRALLVQQLQELRVHSFY